MHMVSAWERHLKGKKNDFKGDMIAYLPVVIWRGYYFYNRILKLLCQMKIPAVRK